VLIEAKRPVPQPLPVLRRTIAALPTLLPWVPTLSTVEPAANQPVAQIDKTVTLNGFHLDGTAPEVRLVNDRFKVDAPGTLTNISARKIEFKIPAAQADDFPVGVYRVGARVLLAGESAPRSTNQLALTIAPSFVGPATPVNRAGDGSASFSLSVSPALRAGQTARLVLGGAEYAPNPFADLATTLSFVIPDAPVDHHIARVRVDGIDSPIIDMTAPTPKFFDYRLVIQ
jgi:hypothetical protein